MATAASGRWLTRVLAVLAMGGAAYYSTPSAQAADQVVNVYNWGNSIGKDTVANFEKATGIKVVYQEFDSNETLQAKLLSGTSGYDVVVPSDIFWARQLQAGIFQKIDKTKLPNYGPARPRHHEDPREGRSGQPVRHPLDVGHGRPRHQRRKSQGSARQRCAAEQLVLLFDPKYAQKLKSCGISMIDSAADAFGMALIYLKKDPNTNNPADYQAAYELLKSIRPYITQFNSSSYINDLAGNDICLALGWSGDINSARIAAIERQEVVSHQVCDPGRGQRNVVRHDGHSKGRPASGRRAQVRSTSSFPKRKVRT